MLFFLNVNGISREGEIERGRKREGEREREREREIGLI